MNFTAKRVEPQQLGPAEQLKGDMPSATIVSTIGLLKIQKLHSHYLPRKKVKTVEAFEMKQLGHLCLSSTRQPLSTIVSTIGMLLSKAKGPFFYHLKNESCHQNKKGA